MVSRPTLRTIITSSQPSAGRPRGGKEAAAIGPAIADGAHQAVHGQLLVIDGKGDPAADVAAELLHDGEQVGHLAAAQGIR